MTPLEQAITLPIVPGVSIGGVRLGETRQEVIRRLGVPPPEARRLRPGEGENEFLEYGPLTVWLKDGRVFQVVAEAGYQGQAPGGLAVGARWAELFNLYPEIAFHEEEGFWCVPGIEGLGLDLVRPPRAEEQSLFPPWVDEEYMVIDPEHAFVLDIFVHLLPLQGGTFWKASEEGVGPIPKWSR